MIRNLTYASSNGFGLEATLYSPDHQVPAPVIVCIHGGAWKLGNRHFSRHLGPYLSGLGAIAIRLRSKTFVRHSATSGPTDRASASTHRVSS